MKRWIAATALIATMASAALAVASTGREPNDTADRANGPIGGEGYTDRVDSRNDTDWFYFRVKPGKRVTIRTTHLGGDCRETFVFFTKGPGGEIFSTDKLSPSGKVTPASWTYDTPRGRASIVAGYVEGDDDDRLGGATGCRLRIRITPASALLTRRGPRDRALLAALARSE